MLVDSSVSAATTCKEIDTVNRNVMVSITLIRSGIGLSNMIRLGVTGFG